MFREKKHVEYVDKSIPKIHIKNPLNSQIRQETANSKKDKKERYPHFLHIMWISCDFFIPDTISGG